MLVRTQLISFIIIWIVGLTIIYFVTSYYLDDRKVIPRVKVEQKLGAPS